jgi:hypothetical protein
MKISPHANIIFVRQRQRARQDSTAVVHSFCQSEPHDVSGALNEEGYVCWCVPEIEDFSNEGGGVLIIHKMQVWQ